MCSNHSPKKKGRMIWGTAGRLHPTNCHGVVVNLLVSSLCSVTGVLISSCVYDIIQFNESPHLYHVDLAL